MDERISRLKTSQEARMWAKNARRLGHLDLEAQAHLKADELRAIEEGFVSPAQRAIAAALYAYEAQQAEHKGPGFRANRTRKMFKDHGALKAAERMVLQRKPSKGFEVLEEAGLQSLSFEAIIDRFPEEFSGPAVAAARARLGGKPIPLSVLDAPTARPLEDSDAAAAAPRFDGEAIAFVAGSKSPRSRLLSDWMPRYRAATQTIAQALGEGRPEAIFELVWKRADNSISHAGQGILKFETVDALREDLIQVICEIHEDGSPTNFEQIVERFERWKAEGRTGMVPRLLIARAFAAVHPQRYHTTVDESSHILAIKWFVEHTGFVQPRASSWAVRAQALAKHLDRANVFGEDPMARNLFPWFVVEQLQARNASSALLLGHTPRALTAISDLPQSQRVIELRHNAVQAALFAHLKTEFERVKTECPTGTGGFADAVAWLPDGRCQLYEIKIAETAVEVVRQAMGQLLEYAFRTGGLEPVRLFAVGEAQADELTSVFLTRLRVQFNLDIQYLCIKLPSDL